MALAWLHPPTRAPGRGAAGSVLTLDVDGDRGLLSSGDGFVGGSAHDALPVLHVAGGDEEGTHNALTLAVAKQGLQGGEKALVTCHSAGVAWVGHVPALERRREPCGWRWVSSAHPGEPVSMQSQGLPLAPWPRRVLGFGWNKEQESFPACVKIILDLPTLTHKRNQAGPDGNQLLCRNELVTILPLVWGCLWVCRKL